MVFEIRVVRSESAALVAEIGVGRVLGRRWQRENGHEPRLRFVLDIDHRGQRKGGCASRRAVRIVAAAGSLGMSEEQLLARDRENVMDRNAASERRAQSELADFLRLRNIADIEDHNGGAIAQDTLSCRPR